MVKTGHTRTLPVWSDWGCSAARSIRCTSGTSWSQSTRAALDLDRVLLVVAGDPWQKRGKVVASARERLMLVEAAVDGVHGVEASSIEVDREAASVTADTLEALASPHRELFLVLGADAVANMSTWRRLDDTRELATVVVVERMGDAHAEPPAGAGRSSGSRSLGSTCRRPTCAIGWRPAGPSTAWLLLRSCMPSRHTASTLSGR